MASKIWSTAVIFPYKNYLFVCLWFAFRCWWLLSFDQTHLLRMFNQLNYKWTVIKSLLRSTILVGSQGALQWLVIVLPYNSYTILYITEATLLECFREFWSLLETCQVHGGIPKMLQTCYKTSCYQVCLSRATNIWHVASSLMTYIYIYLTPPPQYGYINGFFF